ncbi:hypothetical protein AB2B41_04670 [Marimonas sp. MJW-29]|uniref:SIR2-like domain-containing protein n=1 Tax=Sulfitobacter sediminis TaxID=3234186 RepID=A0ABV3RJ36_9RHOB
MQHKSAVIAASPILRKYWRRLEEAMIECHGLILFGYSGDDTHLNLLISKYFREKQIEIVERVHPEYLNPVGEDARLERWRQKLAVNRVVAFWHDNILSHSEWRWQQA